MCCMSLHIHEAWVFFIIPSVNKTSEDGLRDFHVPSTSSSFQSAHLSSTDSIIWGFVLRASQCAWLVLMLGDETVNQISKAFAEQTHTLSEKAVLSEQRVTVSVNVLPAVAALSCSCAISSFCTLLEATLPTVTGFTAVFVYWIPKTMSSNCLSVFLTLPSPLPLLSLSAALCWDPRQPSHHVGTWLLFGELSVRRLPCCGWTWSSGRGGAPGCQCGHGQDVRKQNPSTSHPYLGPSGLWELAEALHSWGVQPIFWLLLLNGAPKSLDQLRHPLSSSQRCASEPSWPLSRRGLDVWRGWGVAGAGWRSGNKSQRD